MRVSFCSVAPDDVTRHDEAPRTTATLSVQEGGAPFNEGSRYSFIVD
jgi:hypothetical protein